MCYRRASHLVKDIHSAMTDSGATQDRALWYVEPGVAALRPAVVAAPARHEVTARAVVSGISRGTESLVFHGRVPATEWPRMRAPFQEGAFPFPVKYGYAMLGRIESGDRVGERVFCLYPHQSRFVVPADATFTIPASVTDERAALAPQMETALNATWDAAPRIGDRIAVVGGGVIGCLVAYLCGRMPGVDVTLIDTNPDRRAAAERLGVAFADPASPPPAGCDIVFHASATSEGLDLALSLSGFESTVVELSWYGDKPAEVHLGGAFHSQRSRLISSQVGAVSEARRARWDHRRRLALALSLCADARLDCLVTEESAFEDLPARLPSILGRPGALCHLIRY
jgi:NADPH:quinone reductase-like Zn-dependent oxidoreductase